MYILEVFLKNPSQDSGCQEKLSQNVGRIPLMMLGESQDSWRIVRNFGKTPKEIPGKNFEKNSESAFERNSREERPSEILKKKSCQELIEIPLEDCWEESRENRKYKCREELREESSKTSGKIFWQTSAPFFLKGRQHPPFPKVVVLWKEMHFSCVEIIKESIGKIENTSVLKEVGIFKSSYALLKCWFSYFKSNSCRNLERSSKRNNKETFGRVTRWKIKTNLRRIPVTFMRNLIEISTMNFGINS